MATPEILDLNIGMVSAYAFAVSKGFPGTEEEFARCLANVGVSIQQIEAAIALFNNQTVPQAMRDVTNAAISGVEQLEAKGTEQKNIVTVEGETQVAAVRYDGGRYLTAIAAAGTDQIDAITAEGETQVAAVTAEGTAQTDAITAEGETQVAAVTAEGTAQKTAVTDEGAEQTAAVQAKGDQVLESIPEDYTALSNAVASTGLVVVNGQLCQKYLEG